MGPEQQTIPFVLAIKNFAKINIFSYKASALSFFLLSIKLFFLFHVLYSLLKEMCVLLSGILELVVFSVFNIIPMLRV